MPTGQRNSPLSPPFRPPSPRKRGPERPRETLPGVVTTTADFAHDPDGPLQNRPSGNSLLLPCSSSRTSPGTRRVERPPRTRRVAPQNIRPDAPQRTQTMRCVSGVGPSASSLPNGAKPGFSSGYYPRVSKVVTLEFDLLCMWSTFVRSQLSYVHKVT